MPACAKCGSPLQVNEEGIAPVLCDRCAGAATARARKGMYTGTLRDYPVTTALMAINVAVFVGMILTGGSIMSFSNQDLLRWGGNWGVRTLGGEYWRLLTSAFVHGNILHIVLNMWCLLVFGQLAERLFGRWQTASIYVLTGIGGSLLSIAYSPSGRLSVGASGAIFGIAGAILSGVKLGNLSISAGQKKAIVSSVVFFAIFSFTMGMSGNTDNMCHLGGFVTGLIVGLPLAAPSSSKGKHILIQAVTLITTAALLTVAGGQLVQAHGQMFRVDALLDHHDYPAAIRTLEKIIASNPDNEDALLRLGAAYEETQQLEKAVAVLEQVSKLNPNSSKIWTALGRTYFANGQTDQAIAALEQAVELDSGNADAQFGLGYAYEFIKEREKAIAAYEAAIKADSDQDDARARLKALRSSSPQAETPPK